MAEIKLDTVKPNHTRGLIELIAMGCMIYGSYELWGWGAAWLCGGTCFFVSHEIDEVVERFTKIARRDAD